MKNLSAWIAKGRNEWNSLRIIQTGNVPISIWMLIAIYSLSVVTSLPGLAISPILGDLETVFNGASQLEIQMLESLPSLVIIPFVLMAGRLSVNVSKRRLMISGLSIFFLSSVLYLLVSKSLILMLVNSVLLGVGAGMVIPLSTGLIADYFTGNQRTKQLGVVSAISNLSLVLATMLAGYLAGLNWHYAFLVYCLSAVSLAFSFAFRESSREEIDKGTNANRVQRPVKMRTIPLGWGRVWKTDWPLHLMGLYLLITVIALVVPFNLSIYMDTYKIGSTDAAGTLISIFFLAIMLPGLFITRLISGVPARNNLGAAVLMFVGLGMFFIHSLWASVVGVTLIGFGYGLMQPLIYDRTAEAVAPARVTFALALVMAMNYSAIIVYPFLQELLEEIFATTSILLPFIASLILCVLLIIVNYRRYRNAVQH